MTKTLSLSLFSCYRSELMGIAMIGVLIAYFIGLGGTIFGPHGMQPPLASTKFPYFFWEYMRDKFHSIIGKKRDLFCFLRMFIMIARLSKEIKRWEYNEK